MRIRRASEDDDMVIAEHYLALWRSYDTPQDMFLERAHGEVLSFLDHGRRESKLATFIAAGDGETIAGSAGCQLRPALYPTVVKPSFRNPGYIWQVYVVPDFRGGGIGHALTGACIDYLATIGCTAVLLHYSEAGRRLYEAMDFRPSNELRLSLV